MSLVTLKKKIPSEEKYISKLGKDEDDDHRQEVKVVTLLDLMKEWLPATATEKDSKDGVAGLHTSSGGEFRSYYEILTGEGFDSIDSMKDLSADDLKEFGFKVGHTRQFVKKRDEYFKSQDEAKSKKEKEEKEKETVTVTKPTEEKSSNDSNSEVILEELKTYKNFVSKERIFIACGRLGGSTGGGGVYCVNPSAPGKIETIREKGYHNAHAMCRFGSDKLYFACGTCFGAEGGGGIWEVDVASGRESELCSGYSNCANLTSVGTVLYATLGQAGGGTGSGGLYRIDSRSGRKEEVGEDWQNTTCIKSVADKVYIICGKAYGCQGGGGLYMIDPRYPNRNVQLGKSEWENATHMTSIGSRLYIICGPPGGAGGIWEVDTEDDRKKPVEVATGWRYASCMAGLEDTKKLYVCNGVARNQTERTTTTPDSAGLYCVDPFKPDSSYVTLQQTGWVNATLMA